MNTQLIEVKKLTTDHKLELSDGIGWQKIKSIGNGFYFGSKLLTFCNGAWSCLLNNDKIEAQLTTV